jgi:chromosome segregation ATPase
MGILAFLTASRLKGELTRQRDEIARLHQMLDMEVAQKQETEKQYAEQQQHIQQKTDDQLQKIEALSAERRQLKLRLAEDRKKIQAEAENKVKEMDIRLATLRQELEDKHNHHAKVNQQNATLVEKSNQLDARLSEMATSLQQSENRIQELIEEKKKLEIDLQKIMGNLTRW